MPDVYGFDHLGTRVRCIEIDCEVGGELHQWPTKRRRRHFEQHERERRAASSKRQREGLRKANSMRRLAERENRIVDARKQSR